ncbi:hypothetical protein ACF061_29730 [Streptomyces sp. NPDC015220]|uniref:hypothetical protein n=1 Tax=Streptomyces sp. NPDC015220 TaxID=3364947 RepID=UPI003701423A
MLLIGLLLLAATVAFVVLAIIGNLTGGPDYSVSMLGNHIATMSPLALFSAGLALALIFCLGLTLMAGAANHRRHSHRAAHSYGRPGTGPVNDPTRPDDRRYP